MRQLAQFATLRAPRRIGICDVKPNYSFFGNTASNLADKVLDASSINLDPQYLTSPAVEHDGISGTKVANPRLVDF
jgi:hypothetical protein